MNSFYVFDEYRYKSVLIISAVVIIYAIAAYLYPYIVFFYAISSHNVNKNQLVVQFNKQKKYFKNTADYLEEDQDNDIYFIRSTGLSSIQAIVYTKDGNIPQPYRPKVIEKISDNWYYCESED